MVANVTADERRRLFCMYLLFSTRTCWEKLFFLKVRPSHFSSSIFFFSFIVSLFFLLLLLTVVRTSWHCHTRARSIILTSDYAPKVMSASAGASSSSATRAPTAVDTQDPDTTEYHVVVNIDKISNLWSGGWDVTPNDTVEARQFVCELKDPSRPCTQASKPRRVRIAWII